MHGTKGRKDSSHRRPESLPSESKWFDFHPGEMEDKIYMYKATFDIIKKTITFGLYVPFCDWPSQIK